MSRNSKRLQHLNKDQKAYIEQMMKTEGLESFMRNGGALSHEEHMKHTKAFSALSTDNEAQELEMNLQFCPTTRQSSEIVRRLLEKAGTNCDKNDEDPFGDGDQTMICGFENENKSQILRNLWSMGGDIEHWLRGYPHSMPAFHFHCVNGDKRRVEAVLKGLSLDERFKLLEKRVTSMRLTALILTIAMSKHPNTTHQYTRYPIEDMDFIGVIQILLRYGARPNAKEVTGKTVVHYGAGSYGTKETLEMVDMAYRANKTSLLVGRPVVLDGLSKTEFNGMKGTLGGFETETGRRVFHPDDPERKEILVKPENIFTPPKSKESKGTCIINKLLISPNLLEIRDRVGSVSMHEVAMSECTDVAKFLLKRAPDILEVEDGSGTSPRRMAMNPIMKSKVNKVITKHLAKESEKKAAKRDIQTEVCENCGVKASSLGKLLLQCSKCLDATYCSKECQLAAWKAGHKTDCKKREEALGLILGPATKVPNYVVGSNFQSGKKITNFQCRSPKGLKVGEKFWMKVQSNGIQSALLLYDETRHCNFYLDPGRAGHKELVEKVANEPAFEGRKSFFKAKFNTDGKCVVFPHTSAMLKW